jgi:hypothetical protein
VPAVGAPPTRIGVNASTQAYESRLVEGAQAARHGDPHLPTSHVAIVDARLAASLLSGRKRIESRFARQQRLPYGRVSPGDRIYFKVAGGEVIGHARALRVRHFDNLTPHAIHALRARYDDAIRAPSAYWHARRKCRYAVLIWLTAFNARSCRLAVRRQYGGGWLVLEPGSR